SLERLSNVAITIAQGAALKGPIILVWDNVNLSFKAYDQRVASDHSVQCGTNATMIEGLEIGPISDLKYVYNRLSMEDLTPDSNDTQHLDKVMRFHLINILRMRVDKFRGCTNTVPEVGPLPVMQSKTYPLRTMRIDQSSVEGNKAVIEDIIKSLQLPEAYFGALKRIILAGDQLTVCRVRSIIKQLKREKTAYARIKTNYGSPGVGGSLANTISLLGRIRVNKDKPNFHAVDELIRHVLDVTALKAWEEVFDTKDLSIIADGLDKSVVERLVQKKADEILFKILSHSQHEERDGVVFVEEESPVKTTASMNSSLFLRDAIVYVELGVSIKAGDIGRIEAILRWMTIMFQAGSTKNYANELLHLFCGLRYAWPDQAKRAILSSMLVNTTGKPNRWLATDMHQEHNNLLIKVIHAAKGGNLSWETLAEKIAAIIETFARTKKKFEAEFGLKHNNTRHGTVDSIDEINILMGALRDHDIFSVHPTRPNSKKAEPVVDLMEQGDDQLAE
ncbi:hypothetical protein EC957_008066, partial [Mortierella hygrophila]